MSALELVLFRIQKRGALWVLASRSLQAAAVLWAGWILLALGDWWVPWPAVWRRMIFMLFNATLLIGWAARLLLDSRQLRSVPLVALLQRRFTSFHDDLQNALDLLTRRPHGVSLELANQFVSGTCERLARVLPGDVFPWRVVLHRVSWLSGLALLTLILRMVPPYPLTHWQERWFRNPKSVLAQWVVVRPGERFRVRVVPTPQLGRWELILRFPSYTGKRKETVRGTGAISALKGTDVTIRAESTLELANAQLHTPWGEPRPVALKRGRQLETTLNVHQSGEYWFSLEDALTHTTHESAHFPLQALSDEPPRVTLLSPAQDLRVAPDARFPLVLQVKDDFGVRRVQLVFRRGSGPEHRRAIALFDPAPTNHTFDWTWDLTSLSLTLSEVVSYYVEVEDHDIVTGPNRSQSSIYTLEVAGYQQEHDEMQKQLARFREDLLLLLADQTEAAAQLAQASQGGPPEARLAKGGQAKAQQEALVATQRKLQDHAVAAAARLGELLPRMERDPLESVGVYQEYKRMQGNMGFIANSLMGQAADALARAEWEEAGSRQRTAVIELEKLAALSEEVFKNRRMEDVIHQAESLSASTQRLEEKLSESRGDLTPEMREALGSLLAKVAAAANEIQRLLRELPQELPEEFVNQEAVKGVPLPEVGRLGDRLREALARGDARAALAAARALAEQAQSILDILRKASGQVRREGGVEILPQRVMKLLREIQQVIQEETKILEETQAKESLRFKAQQQEEMKLLESLGRLHEEAIEQFSKIRFPAQPPASSIAGMLDQVRHLMEECRKEFGIRKILLAQNHLEDIVKKLAALRTLLGPDRSIATDSIAKKEETILDRLRHPHLSTSVFSAADQEVLNELAKRQKGLQQKTAGLFSGAQALSRETAFIGPELSDRLQKAQGAMGGAAGDLEKQDTSSAVPEEQRALSYLLESQNALEEAHDALGPSGPGLGQPVAGAFQIRWRASPGGKGSSGVSGFAEGGVRLPGADEYAPPKEFREEVLQSLSERFPPLFEKAIKEYYKRLTQ